LLVPLVGVERTVEVVGGTVELVEVIGGVEGVCDRAGSAAPPRAREVNSATLQDSKLGRRRRFTCI
jgi:hypothetical protein